jgi:hypothetical protein
VERKGIRLIASNQASTAFEVVGVYRDVQQVESKGIGRPRRARRDRAVGAGTDLRIRRQWLGQRELRDEWLRHE